MNLRSSAGVFVSLLLLTSVACTTPVEEEDEAEGSTDSALQCASSAATKLAAAARKMQGHRSGGYCYRYVKAHLRAAGMPTADIDAKGYGVSAYKFALWAKANPRGLDRMGLRQADVGMNALPKGAVLVWPRGVCGYNKTHGHIEVVIDDNSSRACSDFCGSIKKGCGKPTVFVPKGCAASTPDEEDDADESVKAPAADDADDSDGDEAGDGSCWSPTLGEDVGEQACVTSKSNGIRFQCHEGKWYRDVKREVGPYGPCAK